jgi:hypothetical protein
MLTSTFVDPGGLGDKNWTCTINWGDGSANTVLQVTTMACNANHVYVGAATKITLTVTDKDNGSTTVTRAITAM